MLPDRDECKTEHALLIELRQLYMFLKEQFRQKWDRELPFEEMLFDRWERAKDLGFAEGSSIYQSSYVYGDVKVGKGAWIGPFTLLDGSGTLIIGAYCNISTGVQIYTHDTVKRALTGGIAPIEHAPVIIGDCCYIGPQTVVTKGVNIGSHSVIGACSLVNKDIPPYSTAAGIPCRVIGDIEIDESDVKFHHIKDD